MSRTCLLARSVVVVVVVWRGVQRRVPRARLQFEEPLPDTSSSSWINLRREVVGLCVRHWMLHCTPEKSVQYEVGWFDSSCVLEFTGADALDRFHGDRCEFLLV